MDICVRASYETISMSNNNAWAYWLLEGTLVESEVTDHIETISICCHHTLNQIIRLGFSGSESDFKLRTE